MKERTIRAAASAGLENPFPGLRPFHENEEHLFFGRERQVDQMIDKLAASRMVAVLGTSGSGKTSLVNCGLRPGLHRGLMTRAGTCWRVVQFRPGNQPIDALASALAADDGLYPDYHGAIPVEELVDTPLKLSRQGLVEVVRRARLPQGVNLLVVVDQFEELFRYRLVDGKEVAAGERTQISAAFVDLLLQAKRQTEIPIYIVLTMRSDFLGSCAEFTGLPEAINEGQYLVPRMSRREQRSAIEGPIRVGGAEISPVLLTRLVNDVGDNPDQLSILQHALNRTWARWQEDGAEGPLELRHYEAVGTMTSALDQHAENAFADLKDERLEKCCEKLFKALTDKGTDPRGIRRPMKFEDLCELTRATPAELLQVIAVFREPSRSFLMPPVPEVIKPKTTIDISHESLMRIWARLNRWADQEAQSAQLYRRLSDAAQRHATGNAALWQNPDLHIALIWRQDNEPTANWAMLYGGGFEQAMAFLAESEATQQLELRYRQELEQRELQRAREAAEQQRSRAEEQTKTAHRLRLFVAAMAMCLLFAVVAAAWAVRSNLAAVRSSHAANAARTYAEEMTRRFKAVSEAAVQAKNEAQTSSAAELKASHDAYIAETDAIEAEKKAKGEADRAEREAHINFAHELAGTSVNRPDGDDALKLLLALQAVSLTYERDNTVEREAREALLQAIPALKKGDRSLNSRMPTMRAVAFSPDRSRVATASIDGKAKIWDARTGVCLMTLTGSNAVLQTLAFSPDGKFLATAGMDHVIRLWDPHSGKQMLALPGHASNVLGIAFSADSRRLASGSQDGLAKVWDLTSPYITSTTFSGHTDAVTAVSFSRDGKRLATASRDGSARVWDTSAPDKAPAIFNAQEEIDRSGDVRAVNAVSFSPDGSKLATGGSDLFVRVWTVSNPIKVPALLLVPSGPVWSVAFSPDGKRLAATNNSSGFTSLRDSLPKVLAKVWNLSNPDDGGLNLYGPALAIPQFFGSESALSVTFSADGKQIAMAGTDGIARVYSASSGQELLELSDNSVEQNVLAISPDGQRIVSYGSDQALRIFDAASGLESIALSRTKTGVSFRLAAFSDDGRYLVGASTDNLASVWRVEDGKLVHQLRIGDGFSLVAALTRAAQPALSALALSSDGAAVATITGRSVSLWNTTSGKLDSLSTDYSGSNPIVVFSPDGRLLAATSADRVVGLYDVPSRLRIKSFSHAEGISSIAFFDGGKSLAIGSRDDTVSFWQTQSGQELGSLQIQANDVYGIAFDRSGSTLATLSRDGHLTTWAMGKTSTEIFSVPVDMQLRLAFDSSGTVITTDRKMTIRRYPVDIEQSLKIARRNVRRSWAPDECARYLHDIHCPAEAAALAAVAAANHHLQDGDRAAALNDFQQAHQLDPHLRLDPNEELANADTESLLADGRHLAEAGDWNGASARFAKAVSFNPNSHVKPLEAARYLSTNVIVEEGRNLARSDQRNEALASFNLAKKLDPDEDLNPTAEADKFEAQTRLAQGISAAESGDLAGAVTLFGEAQKLDGSKDAVRDKREANAFHSAGDQIAGREDIPTAIAAYRRAQSKDPTLTIDPEREANRIMADRLLARGDEMVSNNQFDDALVAYNKVAAVYSKMPQLDPNGDAIARAFNNICWKGSVNGHAKEFLEVCDKAVRASNEKNPDVRDSRGLARALTGNIPGAVEDFQFYVDHGNDAFMKTQRMSWIAALPKNPNFFTQAVLQSIKDE